MSSDHTFSGKNSRLQSIVTNFARVSNKPTANYFNSKHNAIGKFYTYTLKDVYATLNVNNKIIQCFIYDNIDRLEHFCLIGGNVEVYDIVELREIYKSKIKLSQQLIDGRKQLPILPLRIRYYFHSKFLTLYKKEIVEYAKQYGAYFG